jgi:serine/threonine protein kinase
MSLDPGAELGPYEIVAVAGSGGMGEVYRARDSRLNRTVAIKILPQKFSSDPALQERFQREAAAISSLSHPNICAVYDIGEQEGLRYLVMEYLEGENLAQRLQRGALPVSETREIAFQVAAALECAHRGGIIHRDIKPSNIALTSTGAKLMDFGLAKLSTSVKSANEDSTMLDTSLTGKNALLGTLPYMSPEQVEGRSADVRSDIFSLGSVIYEMATGRRAFHGSTQASLIASILSSEPPPIADATRSASSGLNRIVEACMTKSPSDRWQSAQDLKIALKWLEDGPVEENTRSSGPVKNRRREIAGWALAALFLATATLLGWFQVHAVPSPVATVRSSLLPPPKSSFLPYQFSISPDGLRLAFVASGPDGRNTLWVRVLSGSSAQQILGTDGASFPFWAPESRRIGFFAEGKLKTVEIGGGAVQTLCAAPAGRGGAWNREGTIVFAPFIAGPLVRVSESGGATQPVTKIAQSSQAHRWPFFLPDGKHFLFFSDWSTPDQTRQIDGIYAGSLDSTDVKLVSSDVTGNVYFASGYLLYIRDRSLMAQAFDAGLLRISGSPVPIVQEELEKDSGFSQSGYSVSQNGSLVFQSAADSFSGLFWFDATGKELGQISGVPGKDPRISSDGRFVAISADESKNGKHYIRIFDVARGISTHLTDSGNDEYPLWSADGKQIFYTSSKDNVFSVQSIPSDGSGPPHSLFSGARIILNDSSRDGLLIYMDLAKGRPVLTSFSIKDRKTTPIGTGAEARISPDGKWIAYIGFAGELLSEIFVQPYPGSGGRIQVSNGGGAQPHWSSDGKEVFYMALDKKLMAVHFDARKKAASSARILFQTRIVAANYVTFQYDISPDGRILINSLASSSSAPLTLLSNWQTRLKHDTH